MTNSPSLDLHGAIAPHLTFLRRFARALSGTQDRGDRFTAATLEAILADRSVFEADLLPRVALFKVFCTIWFEAEDSATLPGDLGDLAVSADQRLDQLAPRARQAFLLNALEEFSIADIATIMQVSADEAQSLYNAGLEAIRAQTRSRIMIIEDEPIIAMDIESIITEMGHECTGIADTRDTAVALAAQTKPDMILSDIQLADGSSGIDAIRDILAASPLPVIFITAFPERLLTGERPEPTFLITKPFKRASVEAAISQALFFNDAMSIDALPEGIT